MMRILIVREVVKPFIRIEAKSYRMCRLMHKASSKVLLVAILVFSLMACEKPSKRPTSPVGDQKQPIPRKEDSIRIKGLQKKTGFQSVEKGAQAVAKKDSIPSFLPKDVSAGKNLARLYCQGCHTLPDPIWLDKKTWYYSVMPNMSVRLGRFSENHQSYDYIPDEWFEKGKAGARVKRAKVFPDKPLVTAEEWQQLVAYYTHEAPENPSLIKPRLDIQYTGFPFRARKLSVSKPLSATITLVKFARNKKHFYVGEGAGNRLKLFDLQGKYLQEYPFGSPPVHIAEISDDQAFVTAIGALHGTDDYKGEIVFLNHSARKAMLIMNELGRPVHTSIGKLVGDGQHDLVISSFGNWTGGLSIYEKTAGTSFEEHKLKNLPGSLQNYLVDFDKDGLQDIVMLKAHGEEGIYFYKNLGQDEFQEQRLIRFPPTYGSNYMELADFNNDGFLDVLMTNGDNADYTPILKDYHGVRIFLNQKDGTLKEDQFFPLHGALKAQAFDYDGDGDLDIAAIAFFLDFEAGQDDGFVLLKNRGNGKFSAHSFENSDWGRWMAMDSGDIDGDGDLDILLGAYNMEADLPQDIAQRWREDPVSLVVLENLGFN